MKLKIAVLLFSLILLSFSSSVSADQIRVMYFNPDGGKYYHEERECKTISPKYYALMEEISESELSHFSRLKPCPKCCTNTINQNAIDNVALTEGSEYMKALILGIIENSDTGLWISKPGRYVAGNDFNEGLYTISIPTNTKSGYSVTYGQNIIQYTVQGPADYTFFFPSGTLIELSDSCILRGLDREWTFQKQDTSYDIINACYLTCIQMPAYQYSVTNLPGTKGFVRLSTINPEKELVDLATIEIQNGERYTFRIPLSTYDFVEFVNCRVYIEKGEG